MRKGIPTVLVVARLCGVVDSAQAVRARSVQTDLRNRLVFTNEPGDGASSAPGGVRALEVYAD